MKHHGIRSLLFFLMLFSLTYGENLESSLIKTGTEAPSFSLPTLKGKREALRVWNGKKLMKPRVNDKQHVVILSFWATYCIPCIKEIPILQKVYDKYKEDDLKVFLISIDEKGKSEVSPFVQKHSVKLPVLLDTYKKTAERYGVKALPSIVILDKNGMVSYSHTGVQNFETLEADIIREYEKAKNGVPVVIPDESDPYSSDLKLKVASSVVAGFEIEDVAKRYNVTVDLVKQWADELKSGATKIW